MAKYDLVFEQINAHLINAANVADTGTWPAWITSIVAAGNGNWVVGTSDNGYFEVRDGKYIAIAGAGSIPFELDSTVIETQYTPAIDEE